MNLFRTKRGTQKRSTGQIALADFSEICKLGYQSLDKNPEIIAGCTRIAELISSMTIYLMNNTDHGDERIVNELSKKVDIYPSKWMTRKTWMDFIVMTMLMYGSGNAIVLPHTEGGIIDDLEPIPASQVSLIPNFVGGGYSVNINGKAYDPSQLLHFVYNPDSNYPWKGTGIRASLREVARNLAQAQETKRGFLSSNWKPSIVVKVDGMIDEFASPAGRKKLLDDYMKTSEAGEPWLIPAEQFDIESIRPLSLSDLAIAEGTELDKRTVAAVLGVPAFVLGVGEYTQAEWDGFINNTIRPIAKGIEQELTRKLLISPNWYWQFNIASLYSYDLGKTASVYSTLYTKGIVTGNEVRDKIGMQPKDGLDDLIILENFIPQDRIGDQKKLKGEDDGN